ncbi:RCC1/BLIP-II [Coniochaeta sp. PMI_546]|nr:RCC1/BLIP-II [Coniochaeta sp. PMI_546]
MAPRKPAATATKATAAAPKKAAAPTKAKKTKTKAAAAAPKKAPAAKKTAAPKKAAAVAAATKAAPAAKETTTAASSKKSPAADSDKENADAVKAKANTKRKREAAEDEEAEEESAKEEASPPPAKKARKVAEPKARKAPPAPKPRKPLKAINEPPTTVLDVYVFGAGENGELGLGADKIDGKKPIDVKRPRLNQNLKGKGVVQIGCGGLHVVALTKDNKILTWGVNDNCALGRNTKWEGGLRDVDAEEDDDPEESGLNPLESTPTEVDTSEIEENTTFVQVVGSDSASFALTSEGKVYGWGTFRASDGILGFTEKIHEQPRPTLIPELKKIKQLATGTNHVLALDDKGKIFAWGDGAQNQLGRKVFEREIAQSLRPVGVGNMPVRGSRPVKITCGSYHSFVLDGQGRVFGWGLNQYGQAGHRIDPEDEESKMQLKPRLVEALAGYKIRDIAGGEHHSVACTEDGKLLTFGRIDGHLLGLDEDVYNDDNTVYEEKNGQRLPHSLFKPVPIEDVPPVASVAVGVDNSFAVTTEGQVYSWGFSVGYQTGQGQTDDVEEPTLIDNTAIRGKKIVFAGSGGPYSVLATVAEEA